MGGGGGGYLWQGKTRSGKSKQCVPNEQLYKSHTNKSGAEAWQRLKKGGPRSRGSILDQQDKRGCRAKRACLSLVWTTCNTR